MCNNSAVEQEIHKTVEVIKPLKSFPNGTQGWVSKAILKDRQCCLEVIFRYNNLTGSDRHNVVLTLSQYKSHLRVTGSAPAFPALLMCHGGW